MLSKSSKYAIRAVLYITNQTQNGIKIGAKEVANKLDIPAPFLAKTLQELSKKDIISSTKGPNGGFYLSKKNNSKTLLDIIDCIDGIQKFNECFLGKHECNDQSPCVVHHIYLPFKNKLIEKLRTKSIFEMANENALNNNLPEILNLDDLD